MVPLRGREGKEAATDSHLYVLDEKRGGTGGYERKGKGRGREGKGLVVRRRASRLHRRGRSCWGLLVAAFNSLLCRQPMGVTGGVGRLADLATSLACTSQEVWEGKGSLWVVANWAGREGLGVGGMFHAPVAARTSECRD